MNKAELKSIIKEEYHNVKSFMEEKYGFVPELGQVISNPYTKSFKGEPMNEAYIVLYSPKKGVKPVATAAYRDKKDAQKWEKDLKRKKGGGITMIVQQKMKGVDEAKLSTVHKAAKKGSYPVSLVVVKDGKVIAQELVKTPAAVPAAFNVIKNYHKHKDAIVHIEDRTGKRLFSESVNEGKHDVILDKLADMVKNSKSFMDVGKELKKNGIKYSFGTSPLPMYIIDKPVKIAILNNKYADGAERVVGTTAIGLMESVNEGMFKVIDQIRQDSKDARDFIKNVFSDSDFKDMKKDKEFLIEIIKLNY